MDMELDYPVYKMLINPDTEGLAEVDFVAIVDRPAIQKDWMAFEQYQAYQVVNDERRIVSGPLMIAGKPIFRDSPEMGKHYVVFDAETIQRIAIKFAKKGYFNNVNESHDPAASLSGKVVIFESFISDSTRGVMPMKGYEDVPDGSWFGSMFIEDEPVWADVKAGKFNGFSVEGMFIYDVPKKTKPGTKTEKAAELLAEIENLLKAIPSET